MCKIKRRNKLRNAWYGLSRRYTADAGCKLLCARWRDFEAFAEDIGRPPDPRAVLCRRDRRLPFQPGNVFWGNAAARRKSLSAWAGELGILPRTLRKETSINNFWLRCRGSEMRVAKILGKHFRTRDDRLRIVARPLIVERLLQGLPSNGRAAARVVKPGPFTEPFLTQHAPRQPDRGHESGREGDNKKHNRSQGTPVPIDDHGSEKPQNSGGKRKTQPAILPA